SAANPKRVPTPASRARHNTNFRQSRTSTPRTWKTDSKILAQHRRLGEDDTENTNDQCEECRTFDQSGCQQHPATNVFSSFGLACHTFNSSCADFGNSETRTDHDQTSTER